MEIEYEKLLRPNYSSSILESVADHGFIIIKNVFKINNIIDDLVGLHKLANDKAYCNFVNQKTQSPIGLLYKTNVGDLDLRHKRYPRCFETIYVPQDIDDLNKFKGIFSPMIHLRNLLIGRPRDFVNWVDVELGLWSACRLQHYFRGGGFFGIHEDVIIDELSEKAGVKTTQMIGVLSKRGEDFETGGAYIIKDETKIDMEDYVEIGDVIVYDGRSAHGVMDIDHNRNFSLDPSLGRWSALVSLYNVNP